TYGFTAITPAAAAGALRGRMQPRIDPRSSVADISLTGTDRREVAATLNALVAEFVRTAEAVNNRNQYDCIARPDRPVDSAAALLQGAEKSLEEYRVRTILQPSDMTTVPVGTSGSVTNPAMATFFTLKQQLDGIRQERQALQRVLAQIRQGQVSPVAFQGIPSAQNTALQMALADLTSRQANLTQLLLTYTDQHPTVVQERKMIQLLTQERIPELTETLIAELTQREAALAGQLADA